jgi:Domain of unknown function (DUF4402)
MRRGAALGLAGLALLGHPSDGAAQQGSIPVSANVPSIALTIAGTRDLDFGPVVQGIPVTVDPQTAAAAGSFQINGRPNAEFQLSFTLPAALQSGAFSLPISFGPASACGRITNVQATCATFDPAVGRTARIRTAGPPNNNYFVWVGGTVTAAPGQPGGIYQGTITATAAYTGN